MNRKVPVFVVLGIFALIGLMSFGSAYDYYGAFGDYFDSTSYSFSKTSGFVNGPVYDFTKSFSKISTSGFLPDGSYSKSTVFVKTETESPGFGGYGQFGGYNNYGNNYGGYHNNYNGYNNYGNNYGYNNYGNNYGNNYPWYGNNQYGGSPSFSAYSYFPTYNNGFFY